MAKVWTIEVGGNAYKYRRIRFQRKLETTTPAKFEGTIQYSAAIDYWDAVVIKRDGTAEFRGFVEIIDIRWNENGRYLWIAGRDNKAILWKKYSDSFSNMHEDTKGFFGQVNAKELMTFILRTPKSDFDPDAYPNNKEGWGIDLSKFGDFTATRTSIGDPNYTKLRRRGYGWRNSGDPFASGTDNVDVEISRSNWTAVDGGAGTPYLQAEDTTYIKSAIANATAIYSFSNLPATTRSVEKVHLTVVWKPDQTWWFWINTECDVYISPDGGSSWDYVGVFGGKGAILKPNPWRHYTWDISSMINSVSKFNDCRIKFVNKSTTLTTNITHAYLSVGYTLGGSQETYDRFDISFATKTIVGMYVESRMDDESYPRDYQIVTVDNSKEDFTSYTEEDPNGHIAVVGTDHIDFDSYLDEDAWLYYDYTADYFETYFKHTFDVKVVTDPVPQVPSVFSEQNGIIAGVWCVSNAVDELWSLENDNVNHLSLSVYRHANPACGGMTGPQFRLSEQNGASGQSTYSAELTEGTTYSVEIERIGNKLTATIYSGSTLLSTLSLTLTGASNTFRYMLACATCNPIYGGTTDGDGAGDGTTVIDTTRPEADNFWNGCILKITSGACSGESKTISNWVNATGTFTVAVAFSAQIVSGVTYKIIRAGTTHCDVDIDDLIIEKETVLVTVTNNTYRDIIHSWTPQSMNHLRIKITSQDANHTWGISQVYIYEAESCDYRAYIETGCTPTYGVGQYIQSVTFNDAYTTPIGPLNLPRGRLIDQINTIVKMCYTGSYVPYEWWLVISGTTNGFICDDRKGSDKAGVTFVKGTNLGGVKRTKDVSDTVQRIRVIGRGEGKRQEDVSCDWINDTTAMGNVNTFYEDVISRKSMVDKEMSELVARIILHEEAEPKDQPIVTVANDDKASMDYDVGDKVTVTDTLTGLSGLHKIWNITKEITNNGEDITLVIDSPERDDSDEWSDVYRRLKELEVGGVTAADWTGEADKESKVSTEVITDFFEKTAKNDEDAAKRDIKDPSWYMVPAPTGYTAPQDANAAGGNRGTSASYTYLHGRKWYHQNDWMKMVGPNAGNAVRTLLIELRGDSGEAIDVYMRQNPKLVFELKIAEDVGTPILWYNGDYFDVGLYDGANDYGYFFRVKASGAGIFKIYACWNETGTPADTQEQLIRSITRNVKYRLEIITEDSNKFVIFNIYDMDKEQKYPPSVIKTNINRNILVRPLYMFLSANDNNADANIRANVYIYKFRTEWEKV